MEHILEVKGLTKRFGGLTAVNNVSFGVRSKEILSVIGPNGAGKSTLFKLIASFLNPTSGEVIYRASASPVLPRTLLPEKGVVRTFRNNNIQEHECARQCDCRPPPAFQGLPARLFLGTKAARQDEEEFGKSADEILSFLNLGEIRDEIAKNLPHGHLRALGIAIGLATDPSILLLDEPFPGKHEPR